MGLSQSFWCLESRTITVYFDLVPENLKSIEGTAWAFTKLLVSGIKNHNCLLCFGSVKFEQYRGHCLGLSHTFWCLESRTIAVYFALFCIDTTFEMRTNEYVEICISIDDQTNAERAFMRNRKMGKESKVVERQRETECVCASVDQNQ
jgi:hypothetical protein